MRILFATVMLLLVGAVPAVANYIQIEDVSIGDRESDHVVIKFDLKWQNSFRTNINDPIRDNWDAAWVFIKWRLSSDAGNDVAWSHAYLNPTGHVIPTNSHSSHGGLTNFIYALGKPDENSDYVGNPSEAGFNPYVGAFIYSSTPGAGHVQLEQVKLHWDFAANGLTQNDQVDIKVFGIEMVFVPEGPFYVGSGGMEVGSFTDGERTDPASRPIPFKIDNEWDRDLRHEPGKLWAAETIGRYNHEIQGNRITSEGFVVEDFPSGYNAFYAMKHEITQKAYVDFLNCLTSNQANDRYISTAAHRHSLDVVDGVFFTSNPHLPKNYLNWADLAAYLDWAALRPMTELEFEKACRGPIHPVPDESAWGSTYLLAGGEIINPGQIDEYVVTDYHPLQVSAKIGLGQEFNEVPGVSGGRLGDYADTELYLSDHSILTFSGWFNPFIVDPVSSSTDRYQGIMGDFWWGGFGGGFQVSLGLKNNEFYARYFGGEQSLGATIGTDPDELPIEIDEWYHFSMTVTNQAADNFVNLYINGEFIDSKETEYSHYESVFPLRLAMWRASQDGRTRAAFNGYLDELRVANAIRSGSWVKAEYKNGVGSLVSIGTEESDGDFYKRNITIDHNLVDDDIQNFPLLVRFNQNNFSFNHSESSGNDIRFFDSNNNPLHFERERHDKSEQIAEYWVRVPNISSSDVTTVIVKYGNAALEDASNPGAVWDNNFLAVWHMSENTKENGGYLFDSSDNNYHARVPTNPNIAATGFGPFRVGVFATGESTREDAGASYWGILDLSGNVEETVIGIGRDEGRMYTGLHGDGLIDENGLANVDNWPGSNALGTGGRGHDFLNTEISRTSCRGFANTSAASRAAKRGGRGVRTATAN